VIKIILKPSLSAAISGGIEGSIIFCDDNSEVHCDNGPAVIHPSGTREWWIHGKRHRIDGPAIINCHGRKEWWYEGELISESWAPNTATEHGWVSRITTKNRDIQWQLLEANPEQGLLFTWFDTDMQDYLIQKRPDLIGKMWFLADKLKEKYKDELSLAGIEI
jgi:hypothetical protein